MQDAAVHHPDAGCSGTSPVLLRGRALPHPQAGMMRIRASRRARPFLTHTAVLEQVGPRIHLQWAAPSSGSAVFISHTHTHTHTQAGLSRAGGSGLWFPVSGTEWRPTNSCLRNDAGEGRTTHQMCRDQVLPDQPAAQEPPRKECAAWRVFFSFKLREAVLLCSVKGHLSGLLRDANTRPVGTQRPGISTQRGPFVPSSGGPCFVSLSGLAKILPFCGMQQKWGPWGEMGRKTNVWTNLHKQPRLSGRNEMATSPLCFYFFFYDNKKHYIPHVRAQARREARVSQDSTVSICPCSWHFPLCDSILFLKLQAKTP